MLDDVHELTDPRVLRGLELLVRHTPPRLRLVLVTRADPPLPLHRLLVSGQLSQLRAADLAFSVAEVAELLDGYDFRARLSDADLAVLQARTEGWAAGLRLAAVSMLGHPDPRRFVLELAGDDRSLAGYLVAEVLDRLPAELRDFLVRTSVVDELSGELADALTGRDDGERTLARLERANVFVVALSSPARAATATTRCSPSCCATSSGARRRGRSPSCGARPPTGTAPTGSRPRPSARRWPWRTGSAPPTCSPSTAAAACSAARTPAWESCWTSVPAEAVRLHPELALLAAAGRIVADDGAEASLELALEQECRLAADRRPRFALLLAACRLLRAGRTGDLDEALDAGRAALDARARDWTPPAPAGWPATRWRSRWPAWARPSCGPATWTPPTPICGAGQVAALSAGLEEVQRACLSHLALVQAVQGRLGDAVATGQAALEDAAPTGAPAPCPAGRRRSSPWPGRTTSTTTWPARAAGSSGPPSCPARPSTGRCGSRP